MLHHLFNIQANLTNNFTEWIMCTGRPFTPRSRRSQFDKNSEPSVHGTNRTKLKYCWKKFIWMVTTVYFIGLQTQKLEPPYKIPLLTLGVRRVSRWSINGNKRILQIQCSSFKVHCLLDANLSTSLNSPLKLFSNFTIRELCCLLEEFRVSLVLS